MISQDKLGDFNQILALPGALFLPHTGKLQKKKWENAMTIDKQSWGYRKNTRLSEFLTTDELVATLVETVRLITFTR